MKKIFNYFKDHRGRTFGDAILLSFLIASIIAADASYNTKNLTPIVITIIGEIILGFLFILMGVFSNDEPPDDHGMYLP